MNLRKTADGTTPRLWQKFGAETAMRGHSSQPKLIQPAIGLHDASDESVHRRRLHETLRTTVVVLTSLYLSAKALPCTGSPPEHPTITGNSPIKEGCLRLNGELLMTVVAEVNRHNVRKLEIVDPTIERLAIGGAICPTDLDRLVRGLRRLGIYAVGLDVDSSNERVTRLAGISD